MVNKLLTALNECSEWGQIFILDAVAEYLPVDNREAQSICERVTPRHAVQITCYAIKRDQKFKYKKS